jgi:type IV pilus assembly protein PilM
MLDYVLPKRHWPIALDIGTDSIKMLQMRRAGEGIAVGACGRWAFPPSVGDDQAKRRELTLQGVRELLGKEGFRGRRVVSALSCEQLKVKNVRLQAMSRAELDEAVRHEAEERFGQPFEPDQLHYLQAGQIRQGVDSYQELIILAAPAEVIESHLSMLTELGLSPELIDAEPLAVFRPFERLLRRQADEDAISVVIDLGHAVTKVVVARGRQIVLIKSIAIGGRDFTEAVARQLNLSHEEAGDLRTRVMREHAERRRQRDGADDKGDPNSVDWTIQDAVRGEVERLAREIALCLRYCSVTFRGVRPRQVIMTGGQAYDPAMTRLLVEHLGVECRIGHPLKGIDTSCVDFESDRRGVLAEWSVCAGLAYRCGQFVRRSRTGEDERHRLSA